MQKLIWKKKTKCSLLRKPKYFEFVQFFFWVKSWTVFRKLFGFQYGSFAGRNRVFSKFLSSALRNFSVILLMNWPFWNIQDISDENTRGCDLAAWNSAQEPYFQMKIFLVMKKIKIKIQTTNLFSSSPLFTGKVSEKQHPAQPQAVWCWAAAQPAF